MKHKDVSKIEKFLVEKAIDGKLTNFTEVADLIDTPITSFRFRSYVNELLDFISDVCFLQKRPDLTALVVKNNGDRKGMPGNGFWVRSIDQVTSQITVKEKELLVTNCIEKPNLTFIYNATLKIHQQIFSHYLTESR